MTFMHAASLSLVAPQKRFPQWLSYHVFLVLEMLSALCRWYVTPLHISASSN